MRIEGPYRHRDGWRCRLASEGRRRWCIVRPSPEEAREAADIAAAAARQSGALSVHDAAGHFLAARRVAGTRESSLERYELALRRFFAPVWTRPVSDLRPARGQGLYDALRTQPGAAGKLLSPDSHRIDLTIAKHFCAWLVETGALKASPLTTVKGVGRKRKGKLQPRIDEARALHDTCMADDRSGATAVLLLMWTGARSGELLSRTVRDVDDGGRVLWIDEERERGWETKNEASRRSVEIPEHLRARVLDLCRGKLPGALLFTYSGKPRRRAWLRRELHILCAKAGVPKFAPHALRGWTATTQARAGVDLRAIAEALGHSSPLTTTRHYVQTQEHARVPERARVLMFERSK